jgi:transposase
MTLAKAVRERIKAAYEEGKGTQEQIATMFGVCRNTVSRLWVAFQTTGSIAPKTGVIRGTPPLLTPSALQLLTSLLAEFNDATGEELATLLAQRGGPVVSKRTMNRALQKLRLTRKKRPSTHRNKIPNASRNSAPTLDTGRKNNVFPVA